MLMRLDCDVLDMGVVPDVPEALERAFADAAAAADVVITSGGVSVGEADSSSNCWTSWAKSCSGRSR